MGYTLLIAEKTNAMRKIAQALAEDGTLEEVGTKEGVSYYRFRRNGREHVIVAAVGHLLTLHNQEKGWYYPVFDYSWVPTFKANRKASHARKYYRVIREISKGADDYIICCDYDTEGCLPAFEEVVVREDGQLLPERIGGLIEEIFEEDGSPKRWRGFDYVEVSRDLSIPAINPDTGRIEFTRIRKVMRRSGDGFLLRITTEDDRRIHVSWNHPVFTQTPLGLQVKAAYRLRVGESLPVAVNPLPNNVSEDIGGMGFSKVSRVEVIPYQGFLYDFETEFGSFMHGDGVLSHNSVIGYNILKHICGVEDGKRMKFSTLVKEELIEAYEKASPHLDFDQIEAGLTRHEVDWIYGINLTRALTLALKRKRGRGFTILSTGRVQGPTLKLLMDREEEIRRFKPVPYWQIELHCLVDGQEIVALHETDKFWDKGKVEEVLKACEGRSAEVVNIQRRKYRQLPPPPFNTTDLQTEAYNQFGYSPSQTMGLAESLYQAGAISYPRSSSQKLPPSINYKRILEALSKKAEYKEICGELLGKAELKPVEGKKEDPAHPAIYPTFEVPPSKAMTPQQRKLYDLVVRRFLSAFGEPTVRESLKVTLEIDGNRFVATGRRSIKEGWTRYYAPYLSFEEQPLPELKIGDTLKVKGIKVLDKETQPPSRYTQGSIIKEMEKRGLGTKATRAEILQTLYDRKYIHGKRITISKLGETVVRVLRDFCPRILDEKLTRRLEEEMEMVMEDKVSRRAVVEEVKGILTDILKEFKVKEEEIGGRLEEGLRAALEDERRLGRCPKCGGELRIIFSPRTRKIFAGCSNYPKCDNSYPLPGGARIEVLGKTCEKCGTPMIRVYRKGKRPFTMCLDVNCPTKEGWGKRKAQPGKVEAGQPPLKETVKEADLKPKGEG